MSAPQTGYFPGAPGVAAYPPRPPIQPEPPTSQELLRQHLVALALLLVLTAITLGVAVSSFDVFWAALRFFLVLYTLGAWVALFKSWRR